MSDGLPMIERHSFLRCYSLLVYVILFIGIVLFFLSVGSNLTQFPLDDAFIFMRYARNIAHGYGYVFNNNERVEGTTSITWTLLLAGMSYLNVHLESAVETLCFTFSVLTIIVLTRMLYKAAFSLPTIFCAVLLLAGLQHFRQSVMLGLETSLYAFFLTLLASVLLSRSVMPSATKTGILGVLIFMTRPESVLTLMAISTWLLLDRPIKAKRAISIRIISIWLSGILIVTIWRLLYFGELIPNSAIAKIVPLGVLLQKAYLFPRIQAGLNYVAFWAWANWPVLVGLPISVWWLFRNNKRLLLLLTALCIPTILVAIGSAGDWMPAYRLLTPVVPIILVASAIGTEVAIRAQKYLWKICVQIALLLGVCTTVLVSSVGWKSRNMFIRIPNPKMYCYRQISLALADHLSEKALVAPESIGITGYYLPKTKIFDFFGLTDPYIAKNGYLPVPTFTFGKHDYQYTMNAKPDVFMFHSDPAIHIRLLNQYGYADEYITFKVADTQCDLYAGLRNDLASALSDSLVKAGLVLTPINVTSVH